MVTAANNLRSRETDTPRVPTKVVKYLRTVEKKLHLEIKGLTKHSSKSPTIKSARVFINRQRADEETLRSHVDEGSVISASVHVCTDDIRGGGLRILGAEGRTFEWPQRKAVSLLFCGGHLTHKTLMVTRGTDYGFIFFFKLEDDTNEGKHRIPSNYVGETRIILPADGHATLLHFCENTFTEQVWTYEKDIIKKNLEADAAAKSQDENKKNLEADAAAKSQDEIKNNQEADPAAKSQGTTTWI